MTSRRLVMLSFLLLAVGSVVTPAGAQITPGGLVIELETLAVGLSSPLGVTHAGDGSGRLFIWEQTGQIRIIDNGVMLATPFLDISAKLPTLGGFFDERGLLGLAFHPNYANNGRFFVRYSSPRAGDPSEPCNDPGGFIVGCHSEVLAEYQVSAGDPNVADPTSEIILISVDEPQFNHDSGEVAFGPDGYLYFTLGDGGGAHDGLADTPISHGPIGHGQNIETLLGSMIRIDVDSAPQAPLPYAIPPDNPFVGVAGADEIYAYGFRNPYKFSFDDGLGGDGSLYVGDVGQDIFEELDIVVKGGNYGWVTREGFHCFDPFNPGMPPANCATTGPLGEPLLDPIVEYTHLDGGLSIVGGFVYRGALSPSLVGTYVFGDFSGDFVTPLGRLYYLDEPTPGSFAIKEFLIGLNPRPYGLFLKGFGEGPDGEIYVCGSDQLSPFGTGGVVERLQVLGPVPAVTASLDASESTRGVELRWRLNHARDVESLRVIRATELGAPAIVARWSSDDVAGRDQWTDIQTEPGQSYTYRVVATVDGLDIESNEVAVQRKQISIAKNALVGNAPNPFNPATEIRFELARPDDVRLRIFDAAGRLVHSIWLEGLPAGSGQVTWRGIDEQGRPVASGVYLVEMRTSDGLDAHRMTLVR